MSNEEHRQPTEEAQPLGSVLADLGHRLIPRLQAFERSLRAFAVVST